MERIDKLKQLFPTYKGEVDVDYGYSDNPDIFTTLEWIDVENNICGYRYHYIAECGCCTTSDYDSGKLSYELDEMADSEFEELIKYIQVKTR